MIERRGNVVISDFGTVRDSDTRWNGVNCSFVGSSSEIRRWMTAPMFKFLCLVEPRRT